MFRCLKSHQALREALFIGLRLVRSCFPRLSFHATPFSRYGDRAEFIISFQGASNESEYLFKNIVNRAAL